MPAKSRSQQRLFGMVHACKKYGKCDNPQAAKIARTISDKDAEDFARTKHDDLPERKLKSYSEFKEQLSSAGRQVAGMTMGSDPGQVQHMAQSAGIDTGKPYRVMMKWLADIEAKLSRSGALGPQAGEEANNNFHQQALQVLQSVLLQAAGGKRQWQLKQQQRNIQKAAPRSAPQGVQTPPNASTPNQ